VVMWTLVYHICYQHQIFFPLIQTGPFNRMFLKKRIIFKI
jgi:hypothetical protein